MRLGPRRGRHEGHGRDDPGERPRTSRAPGPSRRATSSSCFFADEEAGGTKGSHFARRAEHPELFEGVTEAISEVGGYSVTVPTARRASSARLPAADRREGHRLAAAHAHGRAGHGSVPNDENAIVRLAEAIARISGAQVAARVHRRRCATCSTGCPSSPAPASPTRTSTSCSTHLGGAQGFVRGTLQDTANVTMLDAGYKHNVIPQNASATLDCRFLPGPRGRAARHDPRARGRARRGRGAAPRHRARRAVRGRRSSRP